MSVDSQQYREVERFRWYSDGWLAIDRENPLYVVDVRYSSLPNSIDALWGLLLDDQAPPDAHAIYHVERSRRTESLEKLLDLLAGMGCRPLDDV
jgi:inner membrane protein